MPNYPLNDQKKTSVFSLRFYSRLCALSGGQRVVIICLRAFCSVHQNNGIHACFVEVFFGISSPLQQYKYNAVMLFCRCCCEENGRGHMQPNGAICTSKRQSFSFEDFKEGIIDYDNGVYKPERGESSSF